MVVELARRPDVIALTLPVDYWDYLGWRDTLAQPAFSARQRGYAHARRDRQVYTPQVVVNGVIACVGSDRAKVERALEQAAHSPRAVTMRLAETGSAITVDVSGSAGEGEETRAELWLLPVSTSKTVPIGRGENQGRTATYANVVRGMTRIGEWSGKPAQFVVPMAVAHAPDADGYVVILQKMASEGPGMIIAAARSGNR